MQMRIHFAGFVETIYTNLVRDEALAARYFPASLRATLLNLFERWTTPGLPQERSPSGDVEFAATKGRGRRSAARQACARCTHKARC